MREPFFSVIVSSYDRSEIVSRCVASVLASDWEDFEIVVVDDGSSDDTPAALGRRFDDPRLRVVALAENHGMSEARRIGSEAARGRWVVVLDSDWELEPVALGRMRAAIAAASPGVRVLWFRLGWDDGSVSPTHVPRGVVGYRDKLLWWSRCPVTDAVRCVRREVFEATPYHAERRGALDTLYELDLARHETQLYSEEVLCLQHEDASNSWLRDADPLALIPRLRADAPDMLWAAEQTLIGHGPALARDFPGLAQLTTRNAAVQSFILGARRRGVRHIRAALRLAPADRSLWATLGVGLAGPTPTLWAIVLDRRLAARRRRRAAVRDR